MKAPLPLAALTVIAALVGAAGLVAAPVPAHAQSAVPTTQQAAGTASSQQRAAAPQRQPAAASALKAAEYTLQPSKAEPIGLYYRPVQIRLMNQA